MNQSGNDRDMTATWVWGKQKPGWYCARWVWVPEYSAHLEAQGYTVLRSVKKPTDRP